jgi:tetratricopeptide (TPR) repeat protein
MANHYFWFGMIDLKEGKLDSAKMKADSIKVINPQKIILASGNLPLFNYDYLYFEVASAESDSLKAIEIFNEIRNNEEIPSIAFFELIIYTNKPYLIDGLARAYVNWGNTDKAIKEYERLITYDPSGKDRHLVYPVYHYELGLLYEKKGFNEKAIEQYRKFLDIWKNADHSFPQPEDARKRLEKLAAVR